MNASSDIISVDPGQKTLGALHPQINTRILRTRAISRKGNHSARTILLNFLFTPAHPGSNRYGWKSFLLRAMLAAIMIVSGSFILNGEIGAPASPLMPMTYGIIEISLGAMLALGLLTRLAMFAGAAGFGYLALASVSAGIFNMEALLGCLACLTFLILGAGRFSCDFILRKSFIYAGRKRQRKIAGQRLTYRAYRYAAYN